MLRDLSSGGTFGNLVRFRKLKDTSNGGNVFDMASVDRPSINIPKKWTPLKGKNFKGGQATVVPVRHEDGREGVYREIREPMSDVSRKRFQRELEILSRKVQHKAIVTLFDWAADVERPWYISELGDPFDKWWSDSKRRFEQNPENLLRQAVSVLLELSSALSVCHDNRIVHRDIKPKNIIMKRGVVEPWPILIDFGIAHDEDGDRLTLTDQAVGNARFSPDIMRSRLEDVPPWLDVFDLGQLLIWMLDKNVPMDHWQRPVHWKYAVYSEEIPEELQLSVKAFTAACSVQDTSPANGAQVVELLHKLFPPQLPTIVGRIDPNIITNAKRRGETTRLLINAKLQEEIQSSAPLGEKIYRDLRDTLRSVLDEISRQEPSVRVKLDNPFSYQIIGATDLFWMCVGSPGHDIQLRIKVKVVPWCDPLPQNKSNRDFWQRHMPKDAICFTFALEGGVIQAHNTQYLEGRWVTIRRDGSIYLHPLSASFGNFSDNDLGGSVGGPGLVASINDVRSFVISLFSNEKYWEYIAIA